MGYNNEARNAKSNESKKRIIDTALKLIAERGYDNVSIAQIAKEAGVSKGAFYIHFASKEDLIEKEIALFYDDLKLEGDYRPLEKLEHFLLHSLAHIKASGLKMAQSWFSHATLGSFYGKSKLAYDKEAIKEILGDEGKANEVVSVYYGALNLWCFTDGEIEPEQIVKNYLKGFKE